MQLRLPRVIHNLLKTTQFWRENQLILKEFKNFQKIAILAVLFALIAAIFEGITVGFIASFLQGLTNPEEPALRTGLMWFDTLILATEATASQRIYRLSILLLVAVLIKGIFDYLGNFYSKRATLSLVDCLRRRIYDQLASFQLSFFSTASSGSLISTLRGEVNQVQQSFNVLSIFLVQGLKLLAYLVSMLMLSWQLFLASILMFGLISLGLRSLTRQVREFSFEVPKANKAFTNSALSFINGIRTVHACGTQEFERKRYYAATHKIYNSQLGVIRLSALVQPLIEGLGATLLVVMVVFSYGLLISTGRLKAAELLTFLFVLIRTTPLVSNLNNSWVTFIATQGSLNAVSELLKKDDKPYFRDGHRPFIKLKHSIKFESVNFSYNPSEPVLHDIDLTIEQGKTTALIGKSGAGKTTLADLIPRFFDPDKGGLLVDGVDLRSFKINTFRQKIAIVSQETFVFNTTVRENITYGSENVTEAKILEAAEMANALTFIQELPEGFNTVLGDRGIRLSGGQRQRIAIARALLKDPDILILDEATSALDSLTEKLIQESLENLTKGRTVIAIAHRLSTISNADKVVVMEDGRIIEEGTYQQLINKRGKLWEYHEMQFALGKT